MVEWLNLIKHKSSFENLNNTEKQQAIQLSKFFTTVKHSINFLMDCVVVAIAITLLFAYSIPNIIIFIFTGVWFLFRIQDYFRKLKEVKT